MTSRPMASPIAPPCHRAIVRSEGSIRVARRPTCVPGPGELSIATEVAGLCGTDIQMLRGLRDDPAPVIGHEGLARIVAADSAVVAKFPPGTAVVINPTHPSDPSFLLGHNVDGLLQERTVIPARAVAADLVLTLDHQPEPELAALLEPLAAVRYGFEIMRELHPRTLLVVGDGVIGQLAVRGARRWLDKGIRTILVHHTEAGRNFSAACEHAADLLAVTMSGRLPLDAGPVAALLATPRDATVAALESVLQVATTAELTIDLLGGLPAGARSAALPGVDLTKIRATNCGGRPAPPLVCSARTLDGDNVRLFGHRGVANRHLMAAAAELIDAPGRYRELVTHVTDLHGAARIMRQLARQHDRTIEDRRLIKLAVRISNPPAMRKEM